MSKSPSEEIARYLVTQGLGNQLGGTTGWSVNFSKEPAKPDKTITVYDTQGPEPDTDELDIQYLNIQIRVRAKGYGVAFTKIEAIRRHLLTATPAMEAYSVRNIRVTSTVASIGPDESGRDILTINLQLMTQDI